MSGRFVHRHPVSESISCVAWSELPLSVMRTYPRVILGSWMLQGLFSFLLALRQGSPVHRDDRGACSKLPDLYCCTYRSLHLLWELLNWTQLALSFFIARYAAPPPPFLFSSSHLPSFSSASCVQWGAKLFKGGKIDFYLQFSTARPVFCIAEDF